jgi:hypothetical protein
MFVTEQIRSWLNAKDHVKGQEKYTIFSDIWWSQMICLDR